MRLLSVGSAKSNRVQAASLESQFAAALGRLISIRYRSLRLTHAAPTNDRDLAGNVNSAVGGDGQQPLLMESSP